MADCISSFDSKTDALNEERPDAMFFTFVSDLGPKD